jgi:Uncharacterised nucleotidyltransferase
MTASPPPLPVLLRVLRDPAASAGLDLAGWDLLLRQAEGADMSVILLALLEDAGLLAPVPAPARAHLEWARVAGERHAQAVRNEVRQIGRALSGLGLPLILLKGAAYAMAGLAAGRGRIFSDVDILVPKARLGEVEAALMMNGWVSLHQDAYDQRYYREWMHELPPMAHLRRGNVIDVHHAILPETAARYPDPARLRAAALPIAAAEPGMPALFVLAPRDMVLHSAVHLFYEGEFDHGLRNLFDIHRLLLQFGPQDGFWDGLPARARELELARPLFYALRYCRRLLGTPVPDAVFHAIADDAPGRALLALMDRLFLRALGPFHPSCADAFTPLAQGMLYIRGNWLRMPFFLLLRHLFHKAFLSPDAKPAH